MAQALKTSSRLCLLVCAGRELNCQGCAEPLAAPGCCTAGARSSARCGSSVKAERDRDALEGQIAAQQFSHPRRCACERHAERRWRAMNTRSAGQGRDWSQGNQGLRVVARKQCGNRLLGQSRPGGQLILGSVPVLAEQRWAVEVHPQRQFGRWRVPAIGQRNEAPIRFGKARFLERANGLGVQAVASRGG